MYEFGRNKVKSGNKHTVGRKIIVAFHENIFTAPQSEKSFVADNRIRSSKNSAYRFLKPFFTIYAHKDNVNEMCKTLALSKHVRGNSRWKHFINRTFTEIPRDDVTYQEHSKVMEARSYSCNIEPRCCGVLSGIFSRLESTTENVNSKIIYSPEI